MYGISALLKTLLDFFNSKTQVEHEPLSSVTINNRVIEIANKAYQISNISSFLINKILIETPIPTPLWWLGIAGIILSLLFIPVKSPWLLLFGIPMLIATALWLAHHNKNKMWQRFILRIKMNSGEEAYIPHGEITLLRDVATSLIRAMDTSKPTKIEYTVLNHEVRVENKMDNRQYNFKNIDKSVIQTGDNASNTITDVVRGDGDVVMGDKNTNHGSAVNVGGKENKIDSLLQIGSLSFDKETLLSDLEKLIGEMKKRANAQDQRESLQNVIGAQAAVKNGDISAAMRRLKGAGLWARDIAIEIGAKVASEAFAKAFGL